MALTWLAGEKLTAAKMNDRMLPLYVDKSAGAQSVTNSTAYVDDTALQLTLRPNRTYDVRCVLSVTGPSTADIKVQWSLATDLTMLVQRGVIAPALSTTDVTGAVAPTSPTTQTIVRTSSSHTATSLNTYGLDGTNASLIVEEFVIVAGSIGGLLKLQWAQRNANAVAVVVGADSFLIATPVG